jgi:hypothetical protein
MFVSAAWAGALAGAFFAAQLFFWSNVPPITDPSPRLVSSPYQAIGSSAYLFALVFGFIFVVGIPEYVVRPALFGEDELLRSGTHRGEN